MRSAPAFSLLAALALLGAAPAVRIARAGEGPADPLAGLSGAQALSIATDLSAESMKGRKTGFESARKSEDYVAHAMGDMGLDPKDPAGAYLDPFEFLATQVKPPIALSLDGQALAYGKDYSELLYAGEGKVEGEVVFVGYGVATPEKGFDETAGLDLKGKVVLAIRGAPRPRLDQCAEERQIGCKAAYARDHGAVGFLLCDGTEPVVGTIQERFFRPDLPALSVSSAVADRLLAGAKTTLEAEKKRRDGAEKAQAPIATGVKAALEVHVDQRPHARGHNALGAISGQDPDLRGEVVLVGAHMDHLGLDAQGRAYPGADDNASGTAVVLHVARRLTENGWHPKRTVLFVAFGGEEQGLVGSTHLAEGLPFDHDGIACVLNIDMVGQGTTEVGVVGGEDFPEMGKRLLGYLPDDLKKRVKTEGKLEKNGDHWPFKEQGVPAFFLATKGEHPHYHAVGDVAANLKPDCLESAARVLGTLIVRLGDEPERLVTKK